MDTMRGVWLALALAMAGLQAGCGDGLGGGAEQPDRDRDNVPDDKDCAPEDRMRWREVSAFQDTDGDGWGEGPAQTVCAPNVLPPGWAPRTGDCAPADASRWLLLTGLYPDLDGDGATAPGPVDVCAGAALSGYLQQAGPSDCDDQDGRFQAATWAWPDPDGDDVGEGPRVVACAGRPAPTGFSLVEGDCAPLDATRSVLRAYAYVDNDGDGHSVESSGTLCLGDRQPLPSGYSTQPQGADCDDMDPSTWQERGVFVDTDGDGFGAGPLSFQCLGARLPPDHSLQGEDCAPEDRTLWQWRGYAHRDADGDGDTVPENGVRCSGAALPPGYALWPNGLDCDDHDASVRVSWSVHPDEDGDTVGAGARVTVCAGMTVPAGYSTVDTDCAPTVPSDWQRLTYAHRDADGDGYTVPQSGELCTGAALPPDYQVFEQRRDCDDTSAARHTLVQSWSDEDGDGVGAGEPESLCTNGQVPAPGSALGTDCADDDATRWRQHAYAHVDRDEDGATTPEQGGLCAADTLPAPYFTKATGNDCDDADVERSRWVVLYPDLDGDGVGAEPRQIPCLGAALPPGMSLHGYDVDDSDPEVNMDAEDDLQVGLILGM